MPGLASTTLRDAILTITDPTAPGWGGWPADTAAVQARWAAACRTYFAAMLTPSVAPGGHDAAEVAFRAAFTPAAGMTGLASAFAAYTATLATFPVAPQVVVPPAGVPPLAALVLPPTATPGPPATAIAGAVDTWARTGTWAVPPGAAAPWA
jgi:hypothetical protein